MKKILLIILLVVVSGLVVVKINFKKQQDLPAQGSKTKMKITSSAFGHNETIPSKYTCDGENVNPPLEIDDAPALVESLVLVMDDPDAPAGAWVHWTLWNINPATKVIAENSIPEGAVQGVTSFGQPGYGGPCPPSGTHRYFFKLYALDTKLNLSSDADKAKLEAVMAGHIIEQAELLGLYSRQK